MTPRVDLRQAPGWQPSWPSTLATWSAIVVLASMMVACEPNGANCGQLARVREAIDDIGAREDLDAGATEPQKVVVRSVARCTQRRPPDAYPPIPVGGRRAAFFSRNPLATVTNLGGPILRSPRVVGVFFEDDPLRPLTEAFLGSYGCTPAWRDAVGEYGVGDLLAARPIVLRSPPPLETTTDHAAFKRWVGERIDAGELGELTPDDVLLFHLPSDYSPAAHRACQDDEGGHAAAAGVPYGYVRTCGWPADSRAALARRTTAGSRTLMKLATNPFPETAPAWSKISAGVIIESSTPIPPEPSRSDPREGPDLCTTDYPMQPETYPFAVARNYSNRRAVAGWQPCIATEPIARCAVIGDYTVRPSPDLRQGDSVLSVTLEVFAEDPSTFLQVYVEPSRQHRPARRLDARGDVPTPAGDQRNDLSSFGGNTIPKVRDGQSRTIEYFLRSPVAQGCVDAALTAGTTHTYNDGPDDVGSAVTTGVALRLPGCRETSGRAEP